MTINPYEQYFSIKGGSERQGGEGRDGRIQVFLYSKSRFEDDKDFPARDIILDIFSCYPSTYKEYSDNKEIVKKLVAVQMKRLKTFLEDTENRKNFLDRIFFDRKVDFFVVYHDDIFHTFDKTQVWEIFLKHLEIDNNESFQKVVFKYKVIFAEIEMRTTEGNKYPSMFMPMNKGIMFGLLTEKIKDKKELKPNLWLYGRAIKNYKC